MRKPDERIEEAFVLLDAALEKGGTERDLLLARALRLYQEARGRLRAYPHIDGELSPQAPEPSVSGDPPPPSSAEP